MPALRKLYKEKQRSYQIKQWQKIRQDVSELKNESLENLRELFDERYQTFWMDKEVVESYQILRLHGGVEDLLSFKEFVPEEVPVLFVSATIAISKKVHLPAFGIPRAADLPGANNSQTTPGIIGADRFPRCRFFIFRRVCRRDLSAHR
mgnify:CR=1 FL=1